MGLGQKRVAAFFNTGSRGIRLHGMIEDVDRRLEQWVASVAGPLAVTFSTPSPTTKSATASVYLLDVAPAPFGRPLKEEPPIRILLRYLITPSAEDPREAHRLLSCLLLAALGHREWEVESEPLPAAVWQALGLPPRPSFVLRIPVQRERPAKPVPRVTSGLVIRQSPLGALAGRVVGPGGVSIMGALVEVPGLNLATRTDADGQFVFAALPLSPPVEVLHVNARGRSVRVNLDPAQGGDRPVTVELKESEI